MNHIVPRSAPNFELHSAAIPKYWFDNHPYKTRLLDAMSTQFPEGERYFIACVRDYRDQVKEPELTVRVKDFIYQEAQHGKVHDEYNARLQEQGVRVDLVEQRIKRILARYRRIFSPKTTLAHTVAVEHFTAILAQTLLRQEVGSKGMNPNMRALYLWHAVEELEHKSVAFDVYQKVAKGGYLRRILLMLWTTFIFTFVTHLIMRKMFILDGIGFIERIKLNLYGQKWLWQKGGLVRSVVGEYFAYFHPKFHPDKIQNTANFNEWRAEWDKTGLALHAAQGVK